MTAVPPLSSVHPWEWPGKPWVRIHVDFAGPTKGQMYLIVIDSYSKWLEIIPTDSATAEVTIRALREIMSRWGLPLMMVSDNGPCKLRNTSHAESLVHEMDNALAQSSEDNDTPCWNSFQQVCVRYR